MRPKLIVPIVALSLAACQSQPATQTADTTDAQTAAAAAAATAEADAKALVRRAYEAFNNRDWDAYAEVFAADAESWAADGASMSGVQELTDWDRHWVDGYPDARITSTLMIAEGSFVVSENRFSGTNAGIIVTADGEENPATGNAVDVPYVAVFEIQDGRLQSQRIYYNVVDVLEQLGQMP